MKFLIAFLIVLVGAGFWLTYDNVSNLKNQDQNTIKSLQKTVKDLETRLQDESSKNQNQINSFAKNDEVSQLKLKMTELESKNSGQVQTAMDELKKQVTELSEKLNKKEELGACDQCAVEKCIAAQKKKLEPAPVRKVVQKPYKKPECPNKAQVASCVEERMNEWKASCKITTTPEKIKSSFLSSEKQINKNLKKENETIIVSLEPGTTKVPDLAICLKNKEDIARECDQKYCAGY
jgi:hypothetical protein